MNAPLHWAARIFYSLVPSPAATGLLPCTA